MPQQKQLTNKLLRELKITKANKSLPSLRIFLLLMLVMKLMLVHWQKRCKLQLARQMEL